jgi:CelD/BcsL family acetyltransferase involved in cellulose biosynthesis
LNNTTRQDFQVLLKNMHAQIINGENVFTQLEEEWDELAARSMTDTPFQKLSYQKSWWNNLSPVDGTLWSVVVRDDADRLTAVGCFLHTEDGKLRFNGCIEETDYLDLITTAQDAHESWQLIFPLLLSDQFPSWHQVDFCNVPNNSPTRTILPEVAAQYDLTVVESIVEVCPTIALPDNFESYLESLDSKQRREVRRKLRRADGAEAQLHVVGEADDLTAEVEDFLTLLQKSTFEKRDWLNDGRRALFQEVAKAAQEDGTLQLLFLEVNEQKAAGLFNFDYGDRIWVYNSGLDPELFSALSPGVVITAKAIELAIENGRDEFDFLRGDEEYKYRFGAEDHEIYRLQIVK